MRKKVLWGAAIIVTVTAAGAASYMQLVKAGYIKYNRFDRRDRGSLRVGGTAPDLELAGYDGSAVRLAQLWSQRPVLLVFGSCT